MVLIILPVGDVVTRFIMLVEDEEAAELGPPLDCDGWAVLELALEPGVDEELTVEELTGKLEAALDDVVLSPGGVLELVELDTAEADEADDDGDEEPARLIVTPCPVCDVPVDVTGEDELEDKLVATELAPLVLLMLETVPDVEDP